MTITSRSNPAVKRLRKLRDAGAAEGLAVLEGVKLVEEALAAGATLVEAAVSPRVERHPRGAALVAQLAASKLALHEVTDEILESISDVEQGQGVVALARRISFPEEQLFAGNALVLLAVGVQNPGNVGALLRSAEGAGATGVLLTGCADAWSWKALRGSMGSAFRVPHLSVGDGFLAIGIVRKRGLRVLGTALEHGTDYERVDFRGPVAVVLGSEGSGLDPALLAATDARVRIPMAGAVSSLNVGVAAGVLLFEAARQRRA